MKHQLLRMKYVFGPSTICKLVKETYVIVSQFRQLDPQFLRQQISSLKTISWRSCLFFLRRSPSSNVRPCSDSFVSRVEILLRSLCFCWKCSRIYLCSSNWVGIWWLEFFMEPPIFQLWKKCFRNMFPEVLYNYVSLSIIRFIKFYMFPIVGKAFLWRNASYQLVGGIWAETCRTLFWDVNLKKCC